MAPPVPAIPPASDPGAAAARANPRPTTVPEPMWQTILRSYDKKTIDNHNLAWALGFRGVDVRSTLDAVKLLAKMDSTGDLDVMQFVYARFDNKVESRAFPLAWSNIDVVLNTWNLKAGQGVSTGFKCQLTDRDVERNLARGGGAYATWFCEDDPKTAVHGDRDCFREIVKVGRGLHLCVARQAYNPAVDDTFDDIHVDEWQVPCTRKVDGMCDYHYASAGFLKHMKEAAPWWVGTQKDNAGKWVTKKTDSWKSSWTEWHPFD